MEFKTTNCIALGADEFRKAAGFYQRVLGFSQVDEDDEWIELDSGALRLFITADDGTTPTFNLAVQDVDKAAEYRLREGFSKIGEGDGEVYVRDPFGNAFALTKS